MTTEAGWQLARETYQAKGQLTDTDLPGCQDAATRNGWLEAYRNWWITGTVPPTIPAQIPETPWPMSTWDPLPWDNATEVSDNPVQVSDVIFLPSDQAITALRNTGLASGVTSKAQCGYEAGRVCFQDPNYPTQVARYCLVKLTEALDPG